MNGKPLFHLPLVPLSLLRLAWLRRFFGNCRQAPRHQARMLFSVSLLEVETTADSAQRHQPLEGYTRDISETGLGLIMPSSQISDRLLTDEGGMLRIILLNLPTGMVEIDATAVRSERLQEPEEGHLIGVHITRMNEPDRARLVGYLQMVQSEDRHKKTSLC